MANFRGLNNPEGNRNISNHNCLRRKSKLGNHFSFLHSCTSLRLDWVDNFGEGIKATTGIFSYSENLIRLPHDIGFNDLLELYSQQISLFVIQQARGVDFSV